MEKKPLRIPFNGGINALQINNLIFGHLPPGGLVTGRKTPCSLKNHQYKNDFFQFLSDINRNIRHAIKNLAKTD